MRPNVCSCNRVQIPTNKPRFNGWRPLMKSNCSTIGAKNVLSSPSKITEQRCVSIAA